MSFARNTSAFVLTLLTGVGCGDPAAPPAADGGASDLARLDVSLGEDDVVPSPGDARVDGSPESATILCEAACGRQARAACPFFDEAGCVPRCVASVSNLKVSCQPVAESWLRCAASFAEHTCDASGEPVTTDCGTERDLLRRCQGGAEDAGAPDAPTMPDVTPELDAPTAPDAVDAPEPPDHVDVTAALPDLFDAGSPEDLPLALDIAVSDVVDAPTDLDVVAPDVALDAARDAGPVDVRPSGLCPPSEGTITLPGAAFRATGRTAGTDQITASGCLTEATGPEARWTLQVSERTGVVIDTEGPETSFSTVLSVRTRCEDVSTEQSCDADRGLDGRASLRAVLDPGTYAVLVDGRNRGAGAYVLNARAFAPAPNAVCGGAVILAPGAALAAQETSVGGLRNAACATTTGGPRFYSVTVPASSRVTVTATPAPGSAWTPRVLAADGCTSRTCVADATGASGAAASVLLANTSTAARAFVVSVASASTAEGRFDLSASAPSAVGAGTTCDTATVMSAGQTLSAQSLAGTFRSGAALCASSTLGGQRYYSLRVPARQRATVRVTPTGAAWAPTLRALRACAASGCAASAGPLGPGVPALVTVENADPVDLQAVFTVAGDAPTTAGTFDLSNTVSAIPAGALCDTASALSADVTVSGNTTVATRSGVSLCAPSATGGQLFYTLRVPPMQVATVTAVPTGATPWRPTLRALTSCMASTCQQFAQADGVGAAATLTLDNPSPTPRDLVLSLAGASVPPGGPFELTARLAPITNSPYAVSTIPVNCDELGPETAITLEDGWDDDTATDPFALPFTFPFFGAAMTHLSVSSNGFAQVHAAADGEVAVSSVNLPIPNASPPHGLVAPFWDDLVPIDDITTEVRAGLLGVGAQRRYTVEWRGWQLLGTPSSLTFQAKLFEGGAVEFHHCAMTPSLAAVLGAGATLGIERADGATGVQLGYNRLNAVDPANAVRMVPR